MYHVNMNVSLMVETLTQIKSGITINAVVREHLRKHFVCERSYIWSPSACTCKNGKHARTVIGDSAITCDENIEATKTIPTKSIAIKNVYILLVFFYCIAIDNH